MKRIKPVPDLSTYLNYLLHLALVLLIFAWIICIPTGCNRPAHDEEITCITVVDEDYYRPLHDEYLQSLSEERLSLYLTWSVDLCQLEAMGNIIDANRDIKGFRFYPGLVGSRDVLFICGIAEDHADVTDLIIQTPRGNSFFCPPYCDISRTEYESGFATNPNRKLRSGETCTHHEAEFMIKLFIQKEYPNSGFYGATYFKVSTEQFMVIRQILKKYSSYNISYFSFIMANNYDQEPEENRLDEHVLIMAIDAHDNPILEIPVHVTSAQFSGLCPRFCD
jgi:hypothetical protein